MSNWNFEVDASSLRALMACADEESLATSRRGVGFMEAGGDIVAAATDGFVMMLHRLYGTAPEGKKGFILNSELKRILGTRHKGSVVFEVDNLEATAKSTWFDGPIEFDRGMFLPDYLYALRREYSQRQPLNSGAPLFSSAVTGKVEKALNVLKRSGALWQTFGTEDAAWIKPFENVVMIVQPFSNKLEVNDAVPDWIKELI